MKSVAPATSTLGAMMALLSFCVFGSQPEPSNVFHRTPSGGVLWLGDLWGFETQRNLRPASGWLSNDGLLDVNQADRFALQILPGIGQKLAERIVQNRREHGPYLTVDDLARVKGLGKKSVQKIDHLISVRVQNHSKPPHQ